MGTAAGIGIGTNIVGGELQGWASVLDKQAMAKQFRDEIALQQSYRDAGASLLQNWANQTGSAQAQKDLAAGAGQREQNYQQIEQTPSGLTLPPMQSTSTSRDEAWANLRGQARATLGSYGDWALQNSLRNIQNTESLRQLVSAASGQAQNVYPYQMYQAQHSMDDLAMAGAAISSIGGAAANYMQYANAPSYQQQNQAQWNTLYNAMMDQAYGGGQYSYSPQPED